MKKKTAFNPEIHHRRSIRLKGYDYTQPGAYFITLLTHRRECLFGEIVDQEMQQSELGKIAVMCWYNLPRLFPNTRLDEWVLMPNHFHGIIVLSDSGKGEAPTDKHLQRSSILSVDASPQRPIGTAPGSMNAIIQNFKSVSTRKINNHRDTPDIHVWQRNYFEHIIRDENENDMITLYIKNNPAQWELDQLYNV